MVRPATGDLDHLFDQGLARSSTLRTLAARLDDLRVIVYVNAGQLSGSHSLGRTRFMAAAGNYRYLRIDVDDQLGRVDLLSMIGHELQHAVEIAEAPSVVDEASLIELYQRIGSASGFHADKRWFETLEAVEAGKRVYCELFGRSW